MKFDEVQLRVGASHRATVEITAYLEAEFFPHALERLGEPKEFDQVACGLYARLILIARTLCQLPEPNHFQTVRSSARTAFEVMIDLRELAADPGLAQKAVAHRYAWMFKNARKATDFMRARGVSQRERFRHEEALCDDPAERARFESLCRAHWPNAKGIASVPHHWSGRGLPERVRALGPEYEDFYYKAYAMDCGLVHSGISMTWGFPEEFFCNVFAVGHMNFQKCLLRSTASLCEACKLRPDAANFKAALEDLELHTGRLIYEAAGGRS